MCYLCVEDKTCRCVCMIHTKGELPMHCPRCGHTQEDPKTKRKNQ